MDYFQKNIETEFKIAKNMGKLGMLFETRFDYVYDF